MAWVAVGSAVAGAAASSLFNKGGSSAGGAGGSQTTQQAEPWSVVQPYLSNLYGNANNWYNTQQPNYYPYNTVAPQSQETQWANQLGTQRATQGSAYGNAGQNLATQTLQGGGFGANPGNNYLQGLINSGGLNPYANPAMDYLNKSANGAFVGQNPYLSSAISTAQAPLARNFKNAVLPGVTSMFALGGRYGSNAHQSTISDAANNLGESMGNIATNMSNAAYAQDRSLQNQSAATLGNLYQQGQGMNLNASNALDNYYSQERQRQMQTMGLIPNLQNMDYQNLAMLSGIGQQQQQNNQSNINADMARYGYGQDYQYNQLAKFAGLLNGSGQLGSTHTTTQTLGYNPFIQALGSAGVGNALMQQIFGNSGGMTNDTNGYGLTGYNVPADSTYSQANDYGMGSYYGG